MCVCVRVRAPACRSSALSGRSCAWRAAWGQGGAAVGRRGGAAALQSPAAAGPPASQTPPGPLGPEQRSGGVGGGPERGAGLERPRVGGRPDLRAPHANPQPRPARLTGRSWSRQPSGPPGRARLACQGGGVRGRGGVGRAAGPGRPEFGRWSCGSSAARAPWKGAARAGSTGTSEREGGAAQGFEGAWRQPPPSDEIIPP